MGLGRAICMCSCLPIRCTPPPPHSPLPTRHLPLGTLTLCDSCGCLATPTFCTAKAPLPSVSAIALKTFQVATFAFYLFILLVVLHKKLISTASNIPCNRQRDLFEQRENCSTGYIAVGNAQPTFIVVRKLNYKFICTCMFVSSSILWAGGRVGVGVAWKP